MPTIVQPDGPEDASIVVIGKAPGNDELLANKNYVGYTGQLLFDKILAPNRIYRHDCLRMNLYWEPLGGDDNAWKRLDDPFKYGPQCDTLIKSYPRRLIIAAGEEAFNYLTGESGISSWRGSIFYSDEYNCPIMPMIQPAAIMRDYTILHLCRLDAKKARFIYDNPDFRPHPHTVTHYASLLEECGSQDGAIRALLNRAEAYESAPVLSFDIETRGHAMSCIGFAQNASEAIVLPTDETLPIGARLRAMRMVAHLLDQPMPKVAQNLDFDCQHLARLYGIGVRNVWMDTMVAHACVESELSHSLATLVSIYTAHPFHKDMDKTGAEYWRYCGLDCCTTYEVAMALTRELHDKGILEFFQSQVTMPVTKTLVRMEWTGVRIDEGERKRLRDHFEQEAERATEDPALGGINPKSSQQVLAKLAEMGATPRAQGKVTTGKTALKLLRDKNPKVRPFVDAVLATRAARDSVSKSLKFKLATDGRTRCQFKTSVTKTGRISSTADTFNCGTNLQNQPKRVRSMYVPDEGLVMWACDASQIEARLTAALSGDEAYVRAYMDPDIDLHAETTVRLFHARGVTMDIVRELIPGNSDEFTWRDAGKRARHAMNYGIGPRNLMENMNAYVEGLNITFREAKYFIEQFKTMHPGVVRWWDEVMRRVRVKRILVSPFGRYRHFLDRLSDSNRNKIVAHLPQGMAADHINKALVRTERDLTRIPRADVLIQVHDEIVGQCRKEDIDEVRKIVVGAIEAPMPIELGGKPLICPADFAYGHNWKECK